MIIEIKFEIILLLLILLISMHAVWAAVVEIVIEYNVTEVCSGTVALTLNPSTVAPGGSVTPSASGLSGCDGNTTYFRSDSCGGTQVSSCVVSGSGCTGTAFTAPSTTGIYTYYVCIDKNEDGDFADAGESDSATLTVASNVPTISSLTFSADPVDLIEGSEKDFTVSAVIIDADGWENIVSCSGYLWSPDVTPPLTAAKATHTASCTLSGCSGNSCNCLCSFSLQYYETSGSWTGNITATDAQGNTGSAQGTFTVNSQTAVRIANVYGEINTTNQYPIVFGTLKVGDVNVPATTNPLKIINTGNKKLNITIYADDHVGVNDSSWVIKVGNMTYNSSVSGMTELKHMSSKPTEFYPTGGIPVYPNKASGITEPATFYVYNYMSIPSGFKAQTYSSTYYINAEAI